MKSLIRKHTIVINGRKTSISIEDAFWEPLQEIATARGTSVANVISSIDAHHQDTNLSSAIRLTVLGCRRCLRRRSPTEERLP